MKKLQIINTQFDPRYSTCSTLSPRNFQWTSEACEGYGAVFCDAAIPSGIQYSGAKYAWLVESPELLAPLINYIRANRKLISYSYTALFTCSESLVGLEKNFFYCPSGSNLPWVKERSLCTKTKVCSMFASNKRVTTGHLMRQVVAEKFRDSIDLFGGTLGSRRLGEGIHPDKSEGIAPYMFSIAIENCLHDKYYTEKITDCFAAGTVPIYWGTSKVSEDFNEDGIIRLSDSLDINDLTPELYKKMLPAIQDNLERVCKLRMADEQLFDKIEALR